jgi:MFS family permease
MSAAGPIETGRDRAALTRQAGIGKLSFISVLAGVLVAYGAFAVLAALAGVAAAAIGLNTDLSANNWAELGVGSAIAAAVVLLLAYLFGGYVAGRMARRAGLLHGLGVFILALVIVALGRGHRRDPDRHQRHPRQPAQPGNSYDRCRVGRHRHPGRHRLACGHAGWGLAWRDAR